MVSAYAMLIATRQGRQPQLPSPDVRALNVAVEQVGDSVGSRVTLRLTLRNTSQYPLVISTYTDRLQVRFRTKTGEPVKVVNPLPSFRDPRLKPSWLLLTPPHFYGVEREYELNVAVKGLDVEADYTNAPKQGDPDFVWYGEARSAVLTLR